MKEIVKEIIEGLLTFLIILIMVTYGWQKLELSILGKINHNRVDNIISLMLSSSLYGNLNMWCTLQNKK